MSGRGNKCIIQRIVVLKQVVLAIRLAFKFKIVRPQIHNYCIPLRQFAVHNVTRPLFMCVWGLGHETKYLRCTCTLSIIGLLSWGTMYPYIIMMTDLHDSINSNHPEHFSTSFHMKTALDAKNADCSFTFKRETAHFPLLSTCVRVPVACFWSPL